MPTELIDDYAAALRARSRAAPTEHELRRAAILLEDFTRRRDTAGPRRPEQRVLECLDGPIERAGDASLAARAADRDDVHWASTTHPGSIVWPVVTVIGDVLGAPGPRRWAAAAAGYSAITGTAAALGPVHAAIYHSTATAGVVGATATAACLFELDDRRWAHALGHAFSVLGGSRGALIEYSGTRSFHSAHAVRTGIAAAQAAARGQDATRADLDRRQGALATLDVERLLASDDAALAETSLRVFPTSGWNQAAYEAAYQAGIAAAQQTDGPITAISIRTPAAAPPAVIEAVTAAVLAAHPDRTRDELPDLIELQPDSGTTAVRIEAGERAAEATVDAPLDHPSRPAALDQLATSWHCTPTEAADAIERRIAAFTDGRDPTSAQWQENA